MNSKAVLALPKTAPLPRPIKVNFHSNCLEHSICISLHVPQKSTVVFCFGKFSMVTEQKWPGANCNWWRFTHFYITNCSRRANFLIFPQDCPKRHLPTCPPAHLKYLKRMSVLMFNVKNPNWLYSGNVCNEIKWCIKFKILFFRMISSWNWHHRRMNILENLM